VKQDDGGVKAVVRGRRVPMVWFRFAIGEAMERTKLASLELTSSEDDMTVDYL
jgi:hypothetical protein